MISSLKDLEKMLNDAKPYRKISIYESWIETFKKQLDTLMIQSSVEAMVELVDNRSDFQKGWKIGFVDALKKVKGEE